MHLPNRIGTLPNNRQLREGLRDTQCIALAQMRKGEILTNASYRAATGLTDSREATFELQDLVARELVDQTGTRGGSRYTLSTYARSDVHGRRRPKPDRRRQITDLLEFRQEPLSKSEIADELKLNPKTVEHWLRRLRSEGLVESTSKSRSRTTKYVPVPQVHEPPPEQGTLFEG